MMSVVFPMVAEVCNSTVDGYAACLLTEEPTAQTHLNIHFVSSPYLCLVIHNGIKVSYQVFCHNCVKY